MRKIFIFCLSCILLSGLGWAVTDREEILPAEVVLVMTHPTPDQIDNVSVLRERGVLNIPRFRLLGVYHENEFTGFDESRNHVRKNELNWVNFYVVTGGVSKKRLFSKNRWTRQFSQLIHQADGIVFTGGSDLLPSSYNASHHLMTNSETPVRGAWELSFMFHLLGGARDRGFSPLLEPVPDFPVLGICLGAQVMNVAGGGSLWQDIPMQIYEQRTAEAVLISGAENVHSSRYAKMISPEAEGLIPAFHPIKWGKDPRWKERFPAVNLPVWVLSSHHQAIRVLAKDLTVQATSMDGKVVEAVSHVRFTNVLGVQFHPEYRFLFRPGKRFRKTPAGARNVSLPEFLSGHPDSLSFHRQLWAWFAKAMIHSSDRRLKNPDLK